MIDQKDIEKMSVPERLKAIELLWESITERSEYIESPDWHGEILKKRRDVVESGKAKYLSISQVRERLKNKSDEENHNT